MRKGLPRPIEVHTVDAASSISLLEAIQSLYPMMALIHVFSEYQMQKLMMFMKRKQAISFDEFRKHYEIVHIPMVAKWVGHLMSDFKRYYPQDAINLYVGRPDSDQAPANDGGVNYDAVSIYSIRDEAALKELLRIAVDPEFTRAVTEDEANFADRAVSRQTLSEEFSGPGLI